MPSTYHLTTPFDKIALSLSGGGYRAAAFHLGSMAYLHHVRFRGRPLLEHVKIISTVSGGTITGVFYACLVQQGKPFPEIYRELIRLLDDFDLLEMSINRLQGDDDWPAHKRRNLINAFASIYDEHYVGGATFDTFRDMDRSHLEEVVFNATEFSNGSLFRFQSRGRMGNGSFPVTGEAPWEIKLGDIIAASSCFPGGFEPLAFPDDFLHYCARSLPKLKENDAFAEPIGVMDGGICDNQGISSIIQAERRNRDDADYYYDLVIVSDVASPHMEGFHFTSDGQGEDKPSSLLQLSLAKIRKRARRYFQTAHTALLILVAASVLSLLLSRGGNNWLLGAGITGLLFSGLLLLLLRRGRRMALETAGDLWTGANEQFSFYLSKVQGLQLPGIPFRELRAPVLDRAGSLLTLVNDVFLKQIRRLIYSDIYATGKWQYRQISNLIYELSADDFLGDPRRLGKIRKYGPWTADDPQRAQLPEDDRALMQQMLGDRIPEVADQARQFGTTLWFTPKDEMADTLKKLVATGQFTMCYNLIYYINLIRHDDNREESGYATLPAEQQAAVEELHQALMKDWEAFKADPYLMYEES